MLLAYHPFPILLDLVRLCLVGDFHVFPCDVFLRSFIGRHESVNRILQSVLENSQLFSRQMLPLCHSYTSLPGAVFKPVRPSHSVS